MKNEDRLFLLIGAILLIVAIITSARAAHAEECEITDAEVLAKVMYEEARGVDSKTEQAAVAWCVLNRVDHEDYPDTVREVVTQRHQFAWDSEAPVTEELLTLAQDVLLRWELEAYRTIGLSPAEIMAMKEYYDWRARDVSPTQRLIELADADKEGRVVILPHKEWIDIRDIGKTAPLASEAFEAALKEGKE